MVGGSLCPKCGKALKENVNIDEIDIETFEKDIIDTNTREIDGFRFQILYCIKCGYPIHINQNSWIKLHLRYERINPGNKN